jgi:putative flippase GtrA
MAVLAERFLQPGPGGRRSLLGVLVRYGVTGLSSIGADVAVLVLLHSWLDVRLVWATVAGFTVSMVINYLMNHNWTFQAGPDHRRTMSRYAIVVGFNVGSTLLIVLGLTHAGVYYLLSKLVALAINAVVNFTAARFWVFTHEEGSVAVGA